LDKSPQNHFITMSLLSILVSSLLVTSALAVPVAKRGDVDVAPEYYHPSYTQEYKPEYTQKYGYDYQYHEKPKYEYDYKPKYEYKEEKPKYEYEEEKPKYE